MKHANLMICTETVCVKKSVITDIVSGETICASCGLVLSENNSSQDNASNLTQGAKNVPGKISMAMYDYGLSTMIGFKNKDALGKTLSADMQSRFTRLRTWDARSQAEHADRSLKFSFALLDALKANLSIPDMVIERTAQIYRKAAASKMTKGRSIASVLCASLYAACREADIPRTLNDICKAANISRTVLSRSYRTLIRKLDLNLKPYDSSEFVNRIASRAMINEKIKRDALDMLSKITKKGIIIGRNPLGVASSVLYLSCIVNGEKITQETLAKASGVTTVTIRNTIPCIRKELGIK
ncbi:MAG TPA: transcription initiation factor TFIIIB [Candidatus Nitrosotalea sp.]|nr:transcription initiation factor TFIIIB [Candidatus Nitrosotalea sp.]